MKSTHLETIIQRMSTFTIDLEEILKDISETDFQSLSKGDRSDILKDIENIEILTSKAEALSRKTSREGVPELMANQATKKLDNELENKSENKPAPKKRIPNLMKPAPNNNYTTQPKKKDD